MINIQEYLYYDWYNRGYESEPCPVDIDNDNSSKKLDKESRKNTDSSDS